MVAPHADTTTGHNRSAACAGWDSLPISCKRRRAYVRADGAMVGQPQRQGAGDGQVAVAERGAALNADAPRRADLGLERLHSRSKSRAGKLPMVAVEAK